MNKDLHKYSDAELLSFYRRTRKPDYLIGLYERYMPLVYGVALKYLKNVPDAQDAVMQIWEELFEKVLHHDIQVFKAWLYSCVRNYCLMELRRRSGNNFVGLDEKFMEFCDDFNLEYSRETDRQEKALQECMEALPEKQRLCIRYFFLDIVIIYVKSLKIIDLQLLQLNKSRISHKYFQQATLLSNFNCDCELKSQK